MVGAILLGVPPPAFAAPAAQSEPTVTISSPADGSVVTGDVTVVVEVSAETDEVTFAASLDDGATWTELGTDTSGDDGWSAIWDSSGYSGAARLRAVVRDGSSEASDEVDVVVDNAPPAVSLAVSLAVFSPNGDRRKDTTTFEVRSSEPAELTIEVIDGAGVLRRRWQSATPVTYLIGPWRGRSKSGRVRDGRYSVHAYAVDQVGLRGDARASVLIDTRAPRITGLRIGPKLFTRTGVLRTRYRLEDRSRRFKVHLQIADRFGVVARKTRQAGRYGKIRYRTRYRSGRPLFPGLYSARVRIVDDAGNVRLSRRTSWRMHRRVRARVFTRLDNVGRRVALTFDDCNFSDAWRRILRILDAWRVKATFFCSGEQVAWDRAVARQTVRRRHAIGSHGWDHALLSGRSQSESEWRMRRDARLWWQIARDTTVPFYRPAYGGYDRNVVAAAGATGHGRVVLWDVDSQDYRTSSSSLIAARVLSQVRPGSIVLMHVLNQTANALPAILRGLRQRDLRPLDLHRFFRAGGLR